ncbi:MAG: hypothetical protein OWQ48_03825 [Desulfurococcus sp.]|nr:hypothetical protein [Desulfurococcus sp.]
MVAVEEKVLERIREEKNDIIKILRDLVAIPTQNPPGENYEEFTARAREYLSERGVRTEIVRIPDDYARQFVENPREYPRFILLAELKKGKAYSTLQWTLRCSTSGGGLERQPILRCNHQWKTLR